MRATEQLLQPLWGGYGRLLRRRTADGRTEIVKDIRWPRGEAGVSHQRKVRSYEVEASWYERWVGLVPVGCRVPTCLGVETSTSGVRLALEDLDAAGFSARSSLRRREELYAALRWLARFHAGFLGVPPAGLWPEGSYWHLGTRAEELAAMPPGALREAAAVLAQRLSQARFRTIAHGDAKPDNFCLSAHTEVAMVDFQYVGGACGLRDVVYLLDCVHDDAFGEAPTGDALDVYFRELRSALTAPYRALAAELEAEWRALLPVAWLDYQRFLQGWSPAYARPSARLAERIRQELQRL